MDKYKLLFGYLLLVILAILILVIGVGQVEEKTSFGLGSLITVYILLADRWARWAFKDGEIEKSEKSDGNKS